MAEQKNNKPLWIGLAVVLAVILALGVFFLQRNRVKAPTDNTADQIQNPAQNVFVEDSSKPADIEQEVDALIGDEIIDEEMIDKEINEAISDEVDDFEAYLEE